MSEGKIEFHIGNISFVGEGQQDWLSKQLDKVIDNFGNEKSLSQNLENVSQSSEKNNENRDTNERAQKKNMYDANLATFLREQNATSNQRFKFLATAAWLAKNGKNELKTYDVTKALKESKQKSLSNSSQNLIDNVSQGFCEKDGNTFFVTSHGFEEVENPGDEE